MSTNTCNDNYEMYEYTDVFQNPSKSPINQIHLEKSWYELNRNMLKDIDIFNLSDKEIEKKYCDKVTELIPALDKRWLPKLLLHHFEPYIFTLSIEENSAFIPNNELYLQTLNYFLKCNYHQFWCTILCDPNAVISLRSFILNSIPWYQITYLQDKYADVYREVFTKFLLVYDRLLTFEVSPIEYMSSEFGIVDRLINKKYLNLPVVITLTLLYKDNNLNFVNKLTSIYFNNTSQLDFQMKEVEQMIDQTRLIIDMILGHICGFPHGAVIVPISIEKRPKVFDLTWFYSVVNYLLHTISSLNVLFQFHKPAIEIALEKSFPFCIPMSYVTIYRDIYEQLENRDETEIYKSLTEKIYDEINVGRSEFVDVYHTFVSHCLDKALENLSDSKYQENVVEIYIKLINTALEEEYFICDYDVKYNIANQNEMFESCCSIDPTRTQFFTMCISELQRHKRLDDLIKIKRTTIEDVFRNFKPFIEPCEEDDELPGPSSVEQSSQPDDTVVETLIKDIIDMFPHLGDGFVLKCLEVYNYSSSDVINAILEENLPPHLVDIPFDEIRIPPEPEPEQPVLAYKGKKPDYKDTMALLNDKSDMKEIKTFVLEGVQVSNDYVYDDEYDDRYDDDVAIRIGDNPLTSEEPSTFNPNHEELASDTSYSSEDEYDDYGKPVVAAAALPKGDKSKMPFCEDPALIRERREAYFKGKRPPLRQPQNSKKGDVVGKAKGQGQDKNVLQNRQKKNVQKSSKANHSRKGGAQFKRSRGMIPS